MKETSPSRYAHALIRHFIIFSLFIPAFYSQYNNAYYQDIFLGNILATFFMVNILMYWKLDFRQNTLCTILLTLTLLLYNTASFLNYHMNKGLVFWKAYQVNVTIAFLFFLVLLLLKDRYCIISDKLIRLTIRVCLLHNLTGFVFRVLGYCQVQMMNMEFEIFEIDSANKYFSWLYLEASEYALLLLLELAFFIVYRKYFKNMLTYVLSQIILIIGLFLTKSTTFLLAAAIMFGCWLIQYLIEHYKVPKKYVILSIPIFTVSGIAFSWILFAKVDTFHAKFLIWKGHWNMLLEDPLGLRTAFGPLKYYVPNVDTPVNQAHNIFLNHMLRYSLPVGLIYTAMFMIIIVFSFVKKPNYLTAGLWIGLLIPMNMNYSLQTLNLPLALFMIYCIFFHTETYPAATSKNAVKCPQKNITKSPAPPDLEIFDLDLTDID